MNKENATQLDAPARHFSVLLSPTPRGARLARLLATEWLRTWELPYGVPDRAAHVVTGRDFCLALLTRDETLRIEVTDTRGDDLPRPQPSSPDTESGCGLLLVEALTDRWGVELGPVPRKTVWAELDLAPHSPEPGAVCSGGPGALPKEPREGKKPHQAPPLPPTAHAHSRE